MQQLMNKFPHLFKLFKSIEVGKISALADVFEVPVALAQVLISTLTLSLV